MLVRERMDHKLKDLKVDRKTIRWKVPPKGWVKLNFDGANRGNPRISGIGGIIRNDKGEVLKGIASKLGIATNNVIEISGLEWCTSSKHDKIIIEGDS